ncbi:MAG: hypothetical protein EBZ77_06265, partial [Chitinophagia bacterium]|nr:hypothetical protein [Chitinophagia bacterium]
MTGALEFVLNIQGLINGWQQTTATATRGVQQISSSVAQAQALTSNSARTARSSMRDLADSLDNVRRHAEGTHSALKTINDNLPGNGVLGGVLAGGLALGAQQILQATAKAQQDIIGLTTFVGDYNARQIYSQLQKDAAATPFDTKSLLMVDRALISAGVDAKDARLDMLALANAISATGGGNDELARMATNLQQIKTAGKASAEDVKQFAFAGINIYELLAKATGKNVEQVKNLNITYDLLSKSLRMAQADGGMYAGALAAQGQSLSGKWSTV